MTTSGAIGAYLFGCVIGFLILAVGALFLRVTK